MNELVWDEDKPELNITPLVDIMLVLLAILMISTPAVIYKEDINLPDGSGLSKFEEVSALVVRMDREKKIYLDKDVFSFASFADNMSLKSRSYDKSKPVYIRADKVLPYGDVMLVLKVLKDSGFKKVSLVTDG